MESIILNDERMNASSLRTRKRPECRFFTLLFNILGAASQCYRKKTGKEDAKLAFVSPKDEMNVYIKSLH